MEVILLERIEKLGQMGDVVRVRPGYARNYLLPQKKALRATKENLEYFETQRVQLEAENLKRREEAEAMAERLEGLVVVIIRQAGESGQLYGSVTARDIAEALSEQGVTVARRQVHLDQPLKALGVWTARIVLHPEVSVLVTVNIAQSAEEAEAQMGRARTGGEAEGGPETAPEAAPDAGAPVEAAPEADRGAGPETG